MIMPLLSVAGVTGEVFVCPVVIFWH